MMFSPPQTALQKRKKLTKGDFRTKHSNWGHLLLGIGVLIAVEGPVNTYLRAGQFLLFPSTGHRPICCVHIWLLAHPRQHLHSTAMLSCIHTCPCCIFRVPTRWLSSCVASSAGCSAAMHIRVVVCLQVSCSLVLTCTLEQPL